MFQLYATAEVEHGATTNRIKRVRIKPPRVATGRKRYRKEPRPTPRPNMYRVVSVSFYIDELAQIDAAAERLEVSRSELLRRAAARLIMKLAIKVRTCRQCGCTEDDCSGCIARTGAPCWWVGVDLCSACAGIQKPIGKRGAR